MLGDVLWPPCVGYGAAKKKEDNADDLGNPREAMPPLKGHTDRPLRAVLQRAQPRRTLKLQVFQDAQGEV